MRVMLLQPFYFPWIGFFDMMSLCDTFIFYDDAQYSRDSKGGWDARNRIKTPNGIKWLTISIDRHYKLGASIYAIKVNQQVPWRKRHLNQLAEAYHKAPYFEQYFSKIADFLKNQNERLVDYSTGSIRLVANLLGMEVDFKFASSFHIDHSRGAQKVIDICQAIGADEYLDGSSGRELYEPDFFSRHGIKIIFHEYEHPCYRQLHGEFVPYLSILDLLFNEGPRSFEIIKSGCRNIL